VKHSIYIDQLALQHWEGKIDFIDCGILGFIQDLDPKNPKIREAMWRGHFLITRKWLLEQAPMLSIGAEALKKRLPKLCKLGILSVRHRTTDGNKTLAYFKLSDLFYKIHTTRHNAATDAAKLATEQPKKSQGTEIPQGTESQGISVPEPGYPDTRNESIKDSLTSLRVESPLTADSNTRKGEEKKESPADRETLAKKFTDFRKRLDTTDDKTLDEHIAEAETELAAKKNPVIEQPVVDENGFIERAAL
jgi:hypothetical protein